MTHPLIENHADYFAVLARTDSAQPKDERFITRAFASSGFTDEDAGDEGVPFTHDETKLTLACDGDTVVFYHPSNGNYAPMPLMYGDVFIALQRMQWSSAVLYCAGDAEEVLREMAGRIPASYSDFALTAAMPEPSSAEVADLRASIAASPVAQAEPGFMIGSLTEDEPPVDQSSRERWGQIVDDEASVRNHDDEPVVLEAAPVAREQRQPAPAPATVPHRVSHAEPHTPRQKSDDDLSSLDLERLLMVREREIENLHEIIKQMLLGQSMSQFAAAVLPHDAILIAHLYAPSTSKLELLGFERVYNAYTNEEYGVTVDGAFLVFTKDLAGPDWVETLLNRLGGRIERVWQAVPSLVGTLLAQRVPGSLTPADLRVADAQNVVARLDEAIGASAREHVDQSPDNSSQAAELTKPDGRAQSQSAQVDETAPASNLTVEQQKAIDAMGSTFTTIMREVFKASNDTQAVAARVSDLEATR
ncbi:hypothetical protein PWP93_36310 [Paraburkholderia sp. A1RI-2L]|uniref:hypothetical protein n=1 Tax=Paraburkholderia sp. A1RI-2L TaxID=3028367 RepID=UPI003B761676